MDACMRTAAALLLCVVTAAAATAVAKGPVGGILSRSYERGALSSILGRSTIYAAPSRPVPTPALPVAAPRGVEHYAKQHSEGSHRVEVIKSLGAHS